MNRFGEFQSELSLGRFIVATEKNALNEVEHWKHHLGGEKVAGEGKAEVVELEIGCHREGAERPGERGRMKSQHQIAMKAHHVPVAPSQARQTRWACSVFVWRPFTGRTSLKECYKKKYQQQNTETISSDLIISPFSTWLNALYASSGHSLVSTLNSF